MCDFRFAICDCGGAASVGTSLYLRPWPLRGEFPSPRGGGVGKEFAESGDDEMEEGQAGGGHRGRLGRCIGRARSSGSPEAPRVAEAPPSAGAHDKILRLAEITRLFGPIVYRLTYTRGGSIFVSFVFIGLTEAGRAKGRRHGACGQPERSVDGATRLDAVEGGSGGFTRANGACRNALGEFHTRED